MKDRNASCTRAQSHLQLQVRSIWQVEADRSYQVSAQHPPQNTIVLLRCLRGQGQLMLQSGARFTIEANNLLLLRKQDIASYHCSGRAWHFYWFECSIDAQQPLPLEQINLLPIDKLEMELMQEAFSSLGLSFAPQHQLASACVSCLLQRWLCLIPDQQLSEDQQRINQVIAFMHQHLGDALRIDEMAAHIHVSARRLRQLFHKCCGKSPKHYFDELRLLQAKAWLQLGRYTNDEIADALGFSSAFHFSRAFKNHFGLPPSNIRP